jgi:hypothetical protein
MSVLTIRSYGAVGAMNPSIRAAPILSGYQPNRKTAIVDSFHRITLLQALHHTTSVAPNLALVVSVWAQSVWLAAINAESRRHSTV